MRLSRMGGGEGLRTELDDLLLNVIVKVDAVF